MYFGRSNPHFVYKLDNEAIQQVNEENILALIANSEVSWAYSYCTVARNGILTLINQCFNTLDSTSFMTLYKMLVCPILEYGNVVYGPYYQGDNYKHFRISAA